MWPRARYSTPLIQTSRSDDSLGFKLTDRSTSHSPLNARGRYCWKVYQLRIIPDFRVCEKVTRNSQLWLYWIERSAVDWISTGRTRKIGSDGHSSSSWHVCWFWHFLVRTSPFGSESILVRCLVPGKAWNVFQEHLKCELGNFGHFGIFAKITKILWNWVWVCNWDPESLKRCSRRF